LQRFISNHFVLLWQSVITSIHKFSLVPFEFSFSFWITFHFSVLPCFQFTSKVQSTVKFYDWWLLLKYGLAHKKVDDGFSSCYVYQELMKRKFELSPFIAAICILCFSLLSWSSKQILNIVSNLGRQLVGLQLVTEMKLYCVCVFEWFKGFIWGCERTLKVIQGMGVCQLHENQKQLQKCVNFWPDIIECP
jgi:hypothetical protein